MDNLLQSMVALYGAFIRLYPREFRLEFAGEMRSVFMALARDAASTGAPALAVFCLRELRDFPINLIRTHLEENPMSQKFDFEFVRFTLRGILAFVVLIATYNLGFFLIYSQQLHSYTNADGFSIMYTNYYEALLLLFSWLMAALTAGTIFAAILGERCRALWIAGLGIVASLPWSIPTVASLLGLQLNLEPFEMSMANLNNSSIGMRITALLVLVLIAAILAVMLSREQPRFRLVVFVGTIVWLPWVLTSEVFDLTPFLQTEAQIEAQRPFMEAFNILLTLLMGASLAGMLGLLLKDRRKILWLIAAGAILYPLVDYLLYNHILGWFFPMLLFTTGIGYTDEQMLLSSGMSSALTGLLFGLPMALMFVWLRKGKFPALPWMKQQEPA